MPIDQAPVIGGRVEELDEVIEEFVVESLENLDQLDRDLVALEGDPDDKPTLARVFRTMHTIKGTCGSLGFQRLEAVAHTGESVLSRLRDGTLPLTPEIASALLRLVDVVRGMLAIIEAEHREGDDEHRDLVELLVRLGSGDNAPAPDPTRELSPTDEPAVVPRTTTTNVPNTEGDADTDRDVKSSLAESSIRVDVGLLDRLMNLVGELVVACNQILGAAGESNDNALAATMERLSLITSELKEGVTRARMQPIGSVWGKFPRVVRDVSASLGKQVRLEMEGEHTELDNTINETIKDPLVHLVRNAIDHGIETPADRVAAGKPAEARLVLRAYHEGGQVVIEVIDDGRGIDAGAVRRLAVERGIVPADLAERMTDRQAFDLLFLPGFSTAARVTNLSGRGVGMDVVKTNIERIGGTVDVQSQAGAGTTFRLKIPLTLAIIPALVAHSGGSR